KPERRAGKDSGRRPGKQPGSSGSTLELVADPQRTVVHRPDPCANPLCGSDLAHAPEYARQRRQVFEVPKPTMVVTEHQLVAVACGCGRVTLADVPDGVSGRVQYGPTVKAAAVYARGSHFLPFGRAARLLSDLCGASVSTGFVHTAPGVLGVGQVPVGGVAVAHDRAGEAGQHPTSVHISGGAASHVKQGVGVGA